MKKNILFLFFLCLSVAIQATDLSGVKIYVNPGHGGYDSNDRSVWTIPVPELWSNPAGYWESKSNLTKGLALRDMLQAAGATVIMSRVTNTSADDRALSSIAEEANANNVDHFLSIHSNALNGLTNYLLILYRGRQGEPTTPPSDQMAASFGNIQIKNPLTVWTSPQPLLRGDITFYPADWNGLGVLRPLTVPGFLSEGSFHDYPPETHRLCNDDYCKLESLRLFEHFYTWFKKEAPATGTISGWVKSENELVDVLDEPKFTYVVGSDDQWLPLNGATVKLLNASDNSVLKTYTTDDWYNGVFAFYDVAPGNYKISVEKTNYKTQILDVTVEAAKIAGLKVRLKNIRLNLPDYPEPDQEAGLVGLDNYEFESVGGTLQPDWMSGNVVIRRAINRNNKLYVLTETPKLLVVNGSTLALEKEMNLTGINGISDIAFSADNYLLAITKATNGCKVYSWEDNGAEPALLFETDKHAAFANATVGTTMAVTGPRWNCTVYTTVINTEADSSASAIALMGMKYHADTPTAITTKYMQAADALTANAWGACPVLSVMPSGHLYIDSESILPAEYIFDWNAADGTAMEKKSFTAEGITFDVSSCGGTFFRYAKNTYLIMPISDANSVNTGAMLFDVNEGIDKAKKVSDKYPDTGLGATPAPYMTAFAVVNGRDINVSLLAQKQGFKKFRTTSKPILNIYASELSLSDEGNFNFKLNEDAINVIINIYKETEQVGSHTVGALLKGAHSISNPFGDKEFDTWSVTASAGQVAYPVKVSDDSQIFQFYAPRGVAVDNTPESPFFGRIYVTESIGGKTTEGSPANPRTNKMGVYMLDATFADVANQGAESFAGNVNWGTNNSSGYQWTLVRPSVAPDGKVYIPSSTLNGSGIYMMDPANPTADFKPVFSGTRNANGTETVNSDLIHSPIMHCYIEGTGADTKLYTYDRNVDPVYVNIYRYDIGDGSTLPWSAAPSAVVYNDKESPLMLNGNGSIAPDGRGGWWLSQYRYTSSTAVPSLIHITDGKVNYNCGSSIVSSMQGGMAVNKDGSMVAIGRETGKVALYDVVYNAENVPTLTEKFVIDWGNGKGNTMGTAFDAAGNLYIISNSNERLMVYSLPNSNNTYTTTVPAKVSGTGVKTILADTQVQVYPNPVSAEIQIDAQDLLLESYTLYSMTGSMIAAGKISGSSSTISVSYLQEGVYILQLNTSQGIINKRIIKR